VAGEHAEEQAVGPLADLGPGRPAAGRCHAQHELGLLQGAARLRRPAAVGRHPDLGVPPEPRGGPARRVGRAGQERIDLVLDRLRQRARQLGRQRRDQPPRPAAVRLRAERDEPGREVAAQAGGPALHVTGVEVGPGQELLEEGAAQGLLGLVAGLDDRDLRERGDGRHVEVLAGVGSPRPQQQHGAELAPARGDRHLRRHLGRALRAAPREPRTHIALVPRPPLERHPQARHHDRHRRTAVRRGDLGDPLEAVPGQHGAHHLQVGAAGGLPCRVRGETQVTLSY
jgi:hypothetical protein